MNIYLYGSKLFILLLYSNNLLLKNYLYFYIDILHKKYVI
jgi:hypothetical protein